MPSSSGPRTTDCTSCFGKMTLTCNQLYLTFCQEILELLRQYMWKENHAEDKKYNRYEPELKNFPFTMLNVHAPSISWFQNV